LVAAVVLGILPISASTADGPHDCRTLVRRHQEPLRREFCEESGAYRDRLLWIGGVAVVGFLIMAAGRRQEAASTQLN